MANEHKKTDKVEKPKQYGVEPTEQPDKSVHQRDGGKPTEQPGSAIADDALSARAQS